MDLADLKESFVAVDERIKHVLANRISRPYSGSKNLGRRLSGLLTEYRVRAILRYLIDSDIAGFFGDLNREGGTYRTLLEAYRAKLNVPDDEVDASNHSSLACVVAAGNFELCAELDRLMPKAAGEGDDSDAYAFTTLLRTLAARPKDALATLTAFEEECAETPHLENLVPAARGLLENDAKVFAKGLKGYLDSFANLDYAEQEELEPGEDVLSIEGLAFLQLAKRHGLKLQFEHAMTPRELQSPAKAVPADGYPTWPG